MIYKKCNPHFDEQYFAAPELENSYWAGFIAADGCIVTPSVGQKQLQISLNYLDAAHLESLKDAIGAGMVRQYNYGDSLRAARLTIVSDLLCETLEKNFKITPRKSLTLNPPDLSGNLAYSFIAGYIDGDGCYTRSGNRPTITIRGTFALLAWIADVYGLDKTPRLESGVHTISFNGDDAINIRNSFNNLGLPLLLRKRNRWEEMGLNLKKRKL